MQHPSAFAATAPDRPAVIIGGTGARLTYRDLDVRSNRVAHMLRRRGLGVGAHVALLLENRLEFFEVMWGALRAGVYVTPINWHLSGAEAAYIVEDCGASVLVASAELLAQLEGERLSVTHDQVVVVGGAARGAVDYEAELAAGSDEPIADQCEGIYMFYSSGTTGRPKGIKPPTIGQELGAPNPFVGLMEALFGFGEQSVYLSPAPLYHSAPSGWTTNAHRLGATAVVMERFDALEALALIERHRVTHVQFVPTHLIRLLKLPEEERAKFDLSSLEVVIHAAAPCPPDVKRACIEWFGPILREYYSGSEGVGFCTIGSEEWLEHPGSVGRSLQGAAHILDEDGNEVPTGAEGQVWFETRSTFEYHGDPEKTASAYNGRGWGTLGDIGRLDGDGYLYLTDRVSNMIISGGVNIYPREVEDALIAHPAVLDVAVLGVPDAEMGEAVRAVVQLEHEPDDPDAAARDLIAFCRDRIAHFKCPTSVAFVETMPRLPTGKLARRLLDDWIRAPFPTGEIQSRGEGPPPVGVG
jgi:long-chain acyl-CoA synthetase